MENPNLFSAVTVKEMKLRNRVVVSPMQQYSSIDGKVTDWHLVHLGSRAVGGAGLIITESTAVSPEGRSTLHDAGLYNDEQRDAWKPIIKFVQQQGSKIAVQLGHFGSKGSRSHPNEGLKYLSPEEGGWQTKSSSSIAPFPGMSVPVALTIEEMKIIQQQYISAAKRAVEAGFDAIEIHAAHGYLFHQFYSSIINHRTDEYGGSFENRVRFLLETVALVRQHIPANMPLMIRISAVDYLEDEKAWTLDDSVKLATLLKNAGVDVITASAGGFVFLDKSKVFPAYQVPFAEKIKNETGIITATVGAITTPQQANDIIANNQADLIVIAREFLRNPYFATQAAKELGAELPIPFQYKRVYM
ncbi:MAG: NADH:flavin oxidoreductase/NADH oxidase [Gloeobacteraceae cyanobacterium ES-bin-316]|nr:NADH:flavin oxidoreductase/NADH oxidase [Ferruginibacter sp.]